MSETTSGPGQRLRDLAVRLAKTTVSQVAANTAVLMFDLADEVDRLVAVERERNEAQQSFKRLLDEVWQLRADNVVLRDKVSRLERERDALRASIDRHVASKVCQAYQSDPSWIAAGLCGVAFFTRAEAEAAYRKATGLDVGAAAAQVVVHGEDGERD